MDKDYVINDEQIVIKTPIPFKTLVEMEICHDINRHATINLSVIASVENQREILNTDWSAANILVFKENELLFSGFVKNLICQKESQFLTLKIKGVGQTAKLDREKKKQSFQNTEMTYGQVAKSVIKNYEGAEIIFHLDENKRIGEPIIQYDETDWQFLTRICSHFHGGLVADLRTERTGLHFGIKNGKERNSIDIEIVGSGFDGRYFQNGCYENGMMRSQTFYIVVRTKENWQMGDSYFYEGKKYSVYKRNIIFKHGELIFNYQLGMPGTYYQKKAYNTALIGKRIEGVIKRTEGENVYLQLEIDQEDRADYPWKWTPEINNICYCMPEMDTKATLYFPTHEEKNGQAILATVQNLQNSTYTDTQKREFITNYHKKIGLYPDKIFLEGMNGKVVFSIEDQRGIQMKSSTNISFVADGDVYLDGRNVNTIAPLEVVCRTAESNIELCRDINLYAPGGVKTIGTGNGIKKKKDSEDGQRLSGKDIEHWQASFTAIAAVPAVDFEKVNGEEDVIDLYACSGVPKIANGSTTIALSEVMAGKKESESSFPEAFKAMENYTVKGGYILPEEEKEDDLKIT